MPRNGSAGAGVESRPGERDSVFHPSPGEVQREKEEDVMESETFWNRWKRENLPLECIYCLYFITVNLNKLLKLKIESGNEM